MIVRNHGTLVVGKTVAHTMASREPQEGNFLEPLGWLEWPALLRLAIKLGPAFRD